MDKDIAIRIEGLGKRYQLGSTVDLSRTFRETLMSLPRFFGNKTKNITKKAITSASSEVQDSDGIEFDPDTPQGTFWALRDLNLEIKQGEVVGIIGRNGAGKSTLLKILSRITTPTTGQVNIRGRVGALLEVGTGMHSELTGRENIYLNGSILGMRRFEIDKKFDEIVDFSGVEEFLDTPVKRYSSGMRVRLAFAVAAHLDPEILVIDEVLAVGDAEFRKKCLGKMNAISKEGRTVLFVSHNMSAIQNLCDRTILLNKGRIIGSGPTAVIMEQYLMSDEVQKESCIQLPVNQQSHKIGEARSLSFRSNDGVEKCDFKINEDWTITLNFKIFKPAKHIIAAVVLENFEGVTIVGYWSKPKDLEPGNYEVNFLCDLNLSSQNLRFYVGLSSHEVTFHFLENIGHVHISEVTMGEQPFRSNIGVLSVPHTVEIEPESFSVENNK